MTVRDYLRSLTAYPLPEETITALLEARGSCADDQYAPRGNVLVVTADLYRWLSTAPDLSQGGQSYSLDSDTRAYYRRKANELYRSVGKLGEVDTTVQYGYKGDRL